MASRLVQQLRNVIVSAAQALVPAVSDLHEREPARLRALYLDVYGLVFVLAFPVFALLAVAAPFVGELWVGRAGTAFVPYTRILIAAWLANILSAPAYFFSLGRGTLGWNVTGHLLL